MNTQTDTSQKMVISGGNLESPVRANPYKRITRGNEIDIKLDGEEVEAIVDNAGKYTYLNVCGVDCYVNAALEQDGEYTSAPWAPATKKAKTSKVKEVIAEAAEAVPTAPNGKPKRTRKGKAAKPVIEEVEDADEDDDDE